MLRQKAGLKGGDGIDKEIKIKGLSELLFALDRLPAAFEDNVVRRSMVPGVQILRDAAKTNVVRRTGLLQEAIHMAFADRVSSHYKKVYRVFVSRTVKKVYPKGKSIGRTDKYAGKILDPFYFHYIEMGTRKMSAKPFLRPAFDTNADKAADIIIAKMTEGIVTEVRKL